MPQFNGMRCAVEIDPGNIALQEHNLSFGDRRAECFIHVPVKVATFSISLSTNDHIGPGLAAFVFIDGQYQANRSQTNIGSSTKGSTHIGTSSQIDFRFRQLEESDPTRQYIIGRQWCFSRILTASGTDISHVDRSYIQNLGTIEVVVLRCEAAHRFQISPATDISLSSTPGNHRYYAQSFVADDYGVADLKSTVSAKEVGHGIHAVVEEVNIAAWRGQKGQNPAQANNTSTKPHWSNWKTAARGYGALEQRSEEGALYPPYPQPKIYHKHAHALRLDIQATTGAGWPYQYDIAQPTYIDNMTSPYAVFTFKYRSEAPSSKSSKDHGQNSQDSAKNDGWMEVKSTTSIASSSKKVGSAPGWGPPKHEDSGDQARAWDQVDQKSQKNERDAWGNSGDSGDKKSDKAIEIKEWMNSNNVQGPASPKRGGSKADSKRSKPASKKEGSTKW